LAIVTRSMPAARIARKAFPVVRKWNCLGCGVPRDVTAVSRFTAVKSAEPSTEETGPKALAGCLSSRAVRLAKSTSPAKARVTSGEAEPGVRCATRLAGEVTGAPGDRGGYDEGHSSTRLTKLESPGPSSFAQRYEDETRSLPDCST